MIKPKISFFILGIFLLSISLANAAVSFSNSANAIQSANPSVQSIYGSSASQFWDGLGQDFRNSKCEDGTDIVLMIPPGGCEPMAVRSDLLAERNVQVMCQLSSLRVNPLVKVSAIKSVSFSGQMPSEVAGVSFYPSRAGLRSYNTLEGSPLYNNVGYVVITLKKNSKENTMPKFVSGNLTARIAYDSDKAYGTGDSVIFLQEKEFTGEDSFLSESSFWNGLGYLRLLSADATRTRIGVYTKEGRLIQEVVLKEGETSQLVYFPGFYCKSNFRLKLSELTYPDDSVLLNIDGKDIWVRKDSKILNGRCTVSKLTIFGGKSGEIELSCSGAGRIKLSLVGAYPANISVGNNFGKYDIGSFVFEGNITKDKNYRWYLAHSEEIKHDGFVVLLGSSKEIKSDVYVSLAKKIADIQKEQKDSSTIIQTIKEQLKSWSGYSDNNNLIFLGKSAQVPSSKGPVKFEGFISGLGEVSSSGDQADVTAELKNANAAVEKLLEEHREVRGDLNRWGEIALLEQIEMFDALKDGTGKLSLMQKFIEIYPDSVYASLIESRMDAARVYDFSNAQNSFEINGEISSISLKEFKAVDPDIKKVSFYVDGSSSASVGKGDNVSVGSNAIMVVEEIYSNRVDVDVWLKNNSGVFERKGQGSGRVTLRKDTPLKRDMGGREFNLEIGELNVPTVARIELLSEASRTTSTANFTYKIGIEQRLIELNPNKSSEKAEKLNKTIQKLEERNAQLAEVIKGLKGACLITNLALNLKSLATGYSGESMARQEVMEVWRNICDSERGTTTFGTPKTRDACYSDNAPKIKTDTDAYTKAIESINTWIGTEKNISNFISTKLRGVVISNISMGSNRFESLGAGNLTSWEEIRAYKLNEELKGQEISNPLKIKVKNDRDAVLIPAVNRWSEGKANTEATSSLPIGARGVISDSTGKEYSWSGQTADQVNSLDRGNKPIQFFTRSGKNYLLELGEEINGKRQVLNVFNGSGSSWTQTPESDSNYNDLKNSVFFSSGTCKNANVDPVVTFYDSGSARGLPAVVPFDVKEGWYVKVSNSQGGLLSDEAQGYTSSAIPQTFYICNVGSDLRQTPEDACTSINVNQKTDSIRAIAGCRLDVREMDKLIVDAQEAIRKVSAFYSNKGSTIQFNANRGIVNARRGNPAGSDGPIEECQDFLSPDECSLMFNVCDPVMCPTSRCNLGGKNPVSNVIQSGIVGSLVLCLPNFKLFGGDVYVPICLTGVHAGLEAYTSILKAQRDCLNENAKSGSYVGMCDYMTAVYKCNLFWNNFQPLMSNFLPSIFSALTGQQKAGGGEYMTFQKSWNNMEASLDYFKNTYGKNSFTAFKLGNVQEMGTEVCNSFVGTSFPTTAEALDSMLAPESPYQFYGEFQEILHTGATVPPTSQYKVFAHIFAGNDQGVSYTVYLKNPPTSSYYAGIPYINVETGFVAKGEQKQISKDFTSPAGYKELCVSINGNEQCGFKQVTTDFGVNALTTAYREKQAQQTQITTEKECQQGSASVVGFTSINPQAAVTNVVDPRIDLQGIVRICSSVNPGQGTSKEGGWMVAGYCGDKAITCWLDEESVKQSTGKILDVAGTIAQAEKNLELLNKKDGILSQPDSQERILYTKKAINDLTKENIETQKPLIEGNITDLEERGYSNIYQAQAVYWKYKLYEKIVYLKRNFNNFKLNVEVSLPSASASSAVIKIPSTLGELKRGHILVRSGETYEVVSGLQVSGEKYIVTIKKSGLTSTQTIQGNASSDSISTYGYSFSESNVA